MHGFQLPEFPTQLGGILGVDDRSEMEKYRTQHNRAELRPPEQPLDYRAHASPLGWPRIRLTGHTMGPAIRQAPIGKALRWEACGLQRRTTIPRNPREGKNKQTNKPLKEERREGRKVVTSREIFLSDGGRQECERNIQKNSLSRHAVRGGKPRGPDARAATGAFGNASEEGAWRSRSREASLPLPPSGPSDHNHNLKKKKGPKESLAPSCRREARRRVRARAGPGCGEREEEARDVSA